MGPTKVHSMIPLNGASSAHAIRNQTLFLLRVMVAAIIWLIPICSFAQYDVGIDFRGTQNYVTDPAYAVFDNCVNDGTTQQTRTNSNGQSVTWQWSQNCNAATNESAGVDPRLAGIGNVYTASGGETLTITVPQAGSYNIGFATGSASGTQCGGGRCPNFIFKDGASGTQLFTVNPNNPGIGHFIDAANNNWTAAQWPSGSQEQRVTLTGTTLTVSMAAGNSPSIAHIRMTYAQQQQNFTLSASPPSLSIQEGNLGTSTITATISGGFNNSISLSSSGAPSGTSVSFNPSTIPAPGSGTSTMTITVGSSTPVGTYPITVTGNGGGIQQSTTVTLTVTAQGQPNFTISASPASLSVVAGNQGTSTITTTISGGFNSSISLSAVGVPPGMGVSFNPNTIPAPGAGSSTMTITVPHFAVPGTYPITVNATGGGIKQNTTVTLIVLPPDFGISASPASLTIVQGNKGTSTITTTIIAGFDSPISLSASGAPAGITVGLNPSTIPAPGAGNSTMTITVGISTLPGTYPITVTGNGGGAQHGTTVTVTVSAAPNFGIGGAPSSLSIPEGNQGTSTITTSVCCGFNHSISLSASGAPPGTTVSLNPATIPAPGSGNSTMTIMVGSSTATGVYPLPVTGNGGGIHQSTTVTLTVTGGQPPINAKFMEPYSYALQSSFGQPPYTYKLTSGSLPSGLAMDGSGNIAGTATAVGQFPFQVLVTDSSQPPQQQSSNYTLNVVIGLDTYSGLTAAPVPGCTPTGYFQILKVKGRWVYADPNCNSFYQFSVYDASPEFILQGVFQSRYGNDESKWAKHSLQREVAYGFNTNDIFYSDYMLPVATSNTGQGASIKVPFLLHFSTMNDASYDPTLLGLPEPVKDMCIGQDSNGFKNYCLYTLDIIDPNWTVANQAELGVQISDFLGGFNTIPWVPAISLGDADQVFMFKGNGVRFPNYPHPAMVVATRAFNYNLPPVNGNWQRPVLYGKAGWTCNAIANDPKNFPPGGSYLEKKYGTIAALNQAWGTGNFYTSFCDAGGFGTGTGVLDEDGQHTAWFGNPIDYYNQVGMNPNLLADLNNYLYTMAYQVYYPQVSVVRGYDTNHLLMCGVHGGTGDRGMRPVVAQAFSDAGCQILVLGWNSEYNNLALQANQAIYDQIGLPVTLFYDSSAQADSDYSNHLGNGVYDADYPTQQIRGQHYDSDNLAIYSSQGSNGDYYVMGIDFWGLTDNTPELRNLGFLSLSDNVYDGNCAVWALSVDQWGYPCGGEAANYGDFTDGVTQANSAILQQLIQELLK